VITVTERIRALVVDDSAFMRKVISDLLAADPDIEVIGTARDGLDALDKIKLEKPNVVTLDVEMPRMDGLATLEHLMAECPVPVVMVSSLTKEGADTTVEALSLGAVDFVAKPSGTISLDMAKVREEMVQKVKLASRARLSGLSRRSLWRERVRGQKGEPPPVKPREPGQGIRPGADRAPVVGRPADRLVVIGSSTGGPGALHEIFPDLAADTKAGFLVIQHMPPGFTRSLAERLNEISPLSVREAVEGDVPMAGTALLAPGGYHLVLTPERSVALNQDPPQHGVRPSVDVTLLSAVELYRDRCVGAILTGMGFDGAKGMAALKRAGGRTLAEDEASCVVYGMPRAVVEMGNADRVVPLEEVAAVINQLAAGIDPKAWTDGGP
jgi:two-component system chemotaxis response regulator CheB